MAAELKITIGEDTHEWLSSVITARQMETGNNQQQTPQIPRVPHLLRQIQSNQTCYDPSLVSIGPYHSGKRELRDMEKLKVIFTSKFVYDSGICIEDFYCKVAEIANDAKKCYDEESTQFLHDWGFIRMMLLDGCFILQFIFSLLRRPEDLKMPGHQVALVQRDLLLLENQLPFQVIWSLMVLRFGKKDLGQGKKLISDFIRHIRALPPRQDSCGEMISKFLRGYIWRQSDQTKWGFEETEEDEPVHLLQLLHITHVNKMACSRSSRSSYWYSYRSAKDLRKVGIRFRPNWTNNHSDVELKSSVRGSKLILPPITIDESFKPMLLNLIAYETCCDSTGELWVTSYACFLDSLIQDVEDVKVLQSEGILNIFVREQEVADLFNQMSRNLVPNPYAYSDVKRRIELDSKSIIKQWVAEWLHTYFSSPWSFIALVAATFTIFLTAIQSYVAVFSPDKNL